MITWSDVNVRARGLGTHLLGRSHLEQLSTSADLEALGTGLVSTWYPVDVDVTALQPNALELAVRRGAARQLRTIVRWAGDRARAMSVVLDDEDRRSLRAMLRGALHVTPWEQRLTGLIPTPSLPERALGELARLASVRDMATLLIAWNHPFGAAIRTEAEERSPDLFMLQLQLDRAYALRASRAARRGGRELRAFVRRVIDVENAYTALLLAGAPEDMDVARCFLEGGELIAVDAFSRAAGAADVGTCAHHLAHSLQATPYANLVLAHATDLATLEGAVLQAEIRELERVARVAPLGAAPLLAFLLRLRAEVIDLSRIIWGVALGAPPDAMVSELVTLS